MGNNTFCRNCKRPFVVYHTQLENLVNWYTFEKEGIISFTEKIYSCPYCDYVIISSDDKIKEYT